MTARSRATRRSSARPRARSGQWCTVSTASVASKLPSANGSAVAEACTTGRAPADHLGRGLDGEDTAVGGLVGAGAGTDVQDGAGGAKGVDDGGGDAGVGAAMGSVVDADLVVEVGGAHRLQETGRLGYLNLGMTSRAKRSMERRTLSSGRPPKFIQHRTWPTPIWRIWSMWRATVSGEPKASVSATSPSQVIFDSRSAMARKAGWSVGWLSSMREGMTNFRKDSWYHISASRASARACASVGAT